MKVPPTTNYQASRPENVTLGSNVVFQQQALFLGEGRFDIGDDVLIGYPFAPHFFGFHCLICAEFSTAVITIGSGTSLSNDVSIRALNRIVIGRNCLIGDRVTIYDSDFHEVSPDFRRRSPGVTEPVLIADNVWIGSQVTILRGVEVGQNSVIAAGSIVTRSVPVNSIVAGNPAKIIRKIQ